LEIFRSDRSSKTSEAIYEADAAEESAFLFQLHGPGIAAIGSMVYAAVSIDVPAFEPVDKTNVILFAPVRIGIQLFPTVLLS
jgi:hypothetical protein